MFVDFEKKSLKAIFLIRTIHVRPHKNVDPIGSAVFTFIGSEPPNMHIYLYNIYISSVCDIVKVYGTCSTQTHTVTHTHTGCWVESRDLQETNQNLERPQFIINIQQEQTCVCKQCFTAHSVFSCQEQWNF